MIFYKAIKYKILDFCLESLFNGILRNFASDVGKNLRLRDLIPGMKISVIQNQGDEYYDSIIDYISPIGDIGLYYVWILSRDATVPPEERYATDERTGHYIFEMKLWEDETVIIV